MNLFETLGRGTLLYGFVKPSGANLEFSLINGCNPEIAEGFTGLFTTDIGGNRLCDIAMVRIGED